MRNHAVQRAGFTLVELLAVMMIIGILAGLILGVSSYASRKASESKAIAEMQKIKNGCEEYKIKYGAYPDVTNNIKSISNFVSDLTYTNNAIEDPWGNMYAITNTAFSVTIVSPGQDGLTNTADDIDSSKGQ